MFGKLLDTASLLKAKLAKDELDQALIQATNQDNWQASTTVLHEISSSAYNHQKWKKISQFIWEKLKNNKRWKKILKALNIVEFVLKNGPQFAIQQLKYDLNFFRTMQSFQAFEEGADKGASIRQRSKAIVALLQNEQLLEDERVRAKQIRERMSHLSGNINFSSQNPQKANSFTNKYESFGSSQANTKSYDDNKGFYNYGSGNYGDREENKHHRDDYFQHVSRKLEQPKNDKPREAKKVEQQSPKSTKKIQPIVNLSIKAKKVEQKPSYQTMAQKLMKTTKTTGPIVPDLSYKKKNDEDLLVDTQAYFVQHKYHFQEPPAISKQNPQKQKISNPQPVDLNKKTNNNNAQITPKILKVTSDIPEIKTFPNLLTEFEGLAFLGIDNSRVSQSASPTKKQNNIPPTNVMPQADKNIIIPQNIPTPALAPVPTSTANYLYPQNSISQPLQPIQTNSYPNSYIPQSYGGYPSYPQQPYYGNNIYAFNAYQTNPISNTYPKAPVYNPQYYQPQPQPQPQYNPYTNFNPYTPTSYYNTSATTFSPQQKVNIGGRSNQNAQQNKDQFGQFKNGGSFDIEKINWMSKKQKNLTDLTDFSIDPKDFAKPQKKKQYSNNLKIDPWAW